MQYLCMIYYDEKDLAALNPSEYDQLLGEALAYDDELRHSGHFVVAQALQPVATAATVRIRSGRISATDGPFAETKEQLGGFILIEARDLNEAIQVAARIPPGRLGCVEVRPVKDLPKGSRIGRAGVRPTGGRGGPQVIAARFRCLGSAAPSPCTVQPRRASRSLREKGWTMKFLCLICAERVMEQMPAEVAARHYADYAAFTEEIRHSGHFVDCNRLLPPATAATVRVREGRVSTTDGPFVETKEQVGGYFVIEAKDLGEAVEVAARIPGAWIGCVEVRPIADDESTRRALGFAAPEGPR